MILVIDNYDSFVHNLARYFERLGVATRVVRNDAITVAEVERMQPRAVVLSPGPCTPREAGCSLEVVRQFYRTIPFLGVCLGHQAIAQALGGTVLRGESPFHGRASSIVHNQNGLFAGIPSPLTVGRYHSLVVEPDSLPDELQATAWTTDEATLMALSHRTLPVVGVQFHPESILTQHGYAILKNFLRLAGINSAGDPSFLAKSESAEPAAPRKWDNRPVTF